MGDDRVVRELRMPGLLSLVGDLRLEELVAVVVFGSVARGDANRRSDFDVLFLVEDAPTAATLTSALRTRSSAYMSPLVLTVASLAKEAAERPSFVAHILDEGIVAYRTPRWDVAKDELSKAVTDRQALAREIKSRARDLATFSHAERFRNSPVTALSHLYSIARSVVIVKLLQADIHEYSWSQIFDRYAELRPELQPQLNKIKSLRPYYEYARARADATLPEEAVSTRDVEELVGSVQRLAA